MKLKSKSYIVRGAIVGLFLGNLIAKNYFTLSGTDIIFFADPTAQNIIIVLTCVVIGAFVGHVLRH